MNEDLEECRPCERVLQDCLDSWDPEDKIFPDLLGRLVTGTIMQSKPSLNKIHDRSLTGENKSSFYSHIHNLARQMPQIYDHILANLQYNGPGSIRRLLTGAILGMAC